MLFVMSVCCVCRLVVVSMCRFLSRCIGRCVCGLVLVSVCWLLCLCTGCNICVLNVLCVFVCYLFVLVVVSAL